MATLAKAVYRFCVISIKFLIKFFTGLERSLKCIWKHRIAKAALGRENNAGGTTPDLQVHWSP